MSYSDYLRGRMKGSEYPSYDDSLNYDYRSGMNEAEREESQAAAKSESKAQNAAFKAQIEREQSRPVDKDYYCSPTMPVEDEDFHTRYEHYKKYNSHVPSGGYETTAQRQFEERYRKDKEQRERDLKR